MDTAGLALLKGSLRAEGIERTLGAAHPLLEVAVVPDDLVEVVGDAAWRIRPGGVALHRGNGLFEFGLGRRESVEEVTSAEAVGPAVHAAVTAARRGRCSGVRIAFDLERPAPPITHPPGPDGWAEPSCDVVDALKGSANPLALVGPAVLLGGHVAALRSFAAAARIGVFNTWGAKGVLHWRSRYHVATIGLQRDDVELSGLTEADLVITSGLDQLELPPGSLERMGRTIELPVERLGPTAEVVAPLDGNIDTPPIRRGLSAATVKGWERSEAPPAPSLLTRLYGEVVGPSGLVVSEAGTAGFFVARTSGTTRPGGVVVPAGSGTSGFAVAAALAAALIEPWRHVLAVVDEADTPLTGALLDHAGSAGIDLHVEAWDGTTPIDVDRHRAEVTRGLVSPGASIRHVAVHHPQMADFEAVAGPVTAWS